MAALVTVANYAATVRTLLQDTVTPYRYSDADIVLALNFAILEARRHRADLFLGDGTTTVLATLPSFTAVDATAVGIEQHFRMAIVYYIVGHLSLRDQEEAQDARAAVLLNKFVAQLVEPKS
jgi:hypothetical protein